MANGTAAQATAQKKRKKKASKANGDHSGVAGFGLTDGIDLIVPDMTRNRPIRIKPEVTPCCGQSARSHKESRR